MGNKRALIIGNSVYEDPQLVRLKTPDADVNALAEVLRDPTIGGFDEVTTLVNEQSAAIRRKIAGFLRQPRPDDLLVLYFSGHGVRDDMGQLYLATKDTEHELLSGTALPASFIASEMDRSHARRQLLILDCCHSGAFAQDPKGVLEESAGTAKAFEGNGSGRIVLTATDSTQYALQGDQVIGQPYTSVFTRFLIQGLKTGEADEDNDGRISVSELYNYVYRQVVSHSPRQTPLKWSYKEQGEIVVALNPHPVQKQMPLPSDLEDAINNHLRLTREGAVRELERLLESDRKEYEHAAMAALLQLVNDDSRTVSNAAKQVQANYEARQKVAERVVPSEPASPPLAKQTNVQPVASSSIHRAEMKQAPVVPITDPKSDALLKDPHALKAIPRRYIVVASLLAGIFWSVSFAVSYLVSYDWPSSSTNIAIAIFGFTIGLITGLALRAVKPSFKTKYILLNASIWGIAYLLTQLLFKGNSAVANILLIVAGPLIMSFIVRLSDPGFTWKAILITFVGWSMAHVIGYLVSIALGTLFHFQDSHSWMAGLELFFIGGSIGVAVLLSQVRR